MLDSVMIQQISWFVQVAFDSSAAGWGDLALALAWWESSLDVLENLETQFFFLPFVLPARTQVAVCLREPGFQLAAAQLLLFYSSSSSFHPSFRGN